MQIKIQDSSINFVRILQIVSSSQVFLIFTFALITAVAAQVTLPVKPVPYTLQTMAVLLSGAFLGSRNGAYSQLIYLMLGVLGLPVFAQIPDAPHGLARLIGPTGGYLLAFPIASFLVGYFIEKKKNYLTIILAMFLAEILIITFGVLHLTAFYTKNVLEAIKVGGAIFSIWMVIKVFISASIFYGFSIKKSN